MNLPDTGFCGVESLLHAHYIGRREALKRINSGLLFCAANRDR
jgi:hypothetical protein